MSKTPTNGNPNLDPNHNPNSKPYYSDELRGLLDSRTFKLIGPVDSCRPWTRNTVESDLRRTIHWPRPSDETIFVTTAAFS